MSDLLELALHAHGGLERFRIAKSLKVKLSMSGGLYRIKGYPEGLPGITALLDLTQSQPVARIVPYPHHDQTGHFTQERVWIENRAGEVLEERFAPREAFAGHVRATPWDYLHQLYFTAYALWNYFATPFIFVEPGFKVRELGPHEENGEVWGRLHVTFPAGFATHCAEQIFYFSYAGLLQRIDYVTDVAGGIAAHYCYDHQAFSGLVFPTLRRVVQRTGSHPVLSGPTAVLLLISSVDVVFESGPAA